MAGVLFIVTIQSKECEKISCSHINLQSSSFDKIEEQNESPILLSTKPVNTILSLETDSDIMLEQGTYSKVYGTVSTLSKQDSDYKFKSYHMNINDELICTDANSESMDDTSTNDNSQTRKSWDAFRDTKSSKRSAKKKTNKPLELELPADACMEVILRRILESFNISNASWTSTNDGNLLQIIFTIQFDETYEQILGKFHEWGIGFREGTSVSVVNCNAFHTFSKSEEFDDISTEKLNAQKQTAWNRFMNSVAARLNVAQIVRDVRQEATITFDFLILLVSASILASFGLVEDSTIFLASSMLISPLMGPIIAAIFGTAIKDRSLRSLGVMNELLGICLATLVGFIFGLILCSVDYSYGISDGLSTEIISRCELHSVLVGIFTAIPSGAAAAVGILGGNIGSLVGVAISASLLPPAVNAGILWALACLQRIFDNDETRFNFITKTKLYSDSQSTELAILGAISMCLTISNIICIYVMGILVLKVKEVAPVISKNNRQFWKHDIKIARDLNKNGYNKDNDIIDDFAALPKEDQEALGLNYDFLRNMNLENASYQNTWSPIGNRHLLDPFETKDSYTTIHKFEKLCNPTAQPINVNVEKFGRGSMSIPNRNPFWRKDSTVFKINENKPRRASMPSESFFQAKMNRPLHHQLHNAVNVCNDGKKKRKFIVTPAEDPLLPSTKE